MFRDYGYCQHEGCRLKAVNVKSLCREHTKQRHIASAESKGMVVDAKERKHPKIAKRSEKNKELVKQQTLMFWEIWNERKHKSEVSGLPLGAFDIRYFSHVLTKAAYPKFRLKKENIVLMTPEEHFSWEFDDRKDPKFAKVIELESELKREYYADKSLT
jgi:hypothetical protein